MKNMKSYRSILSIIMVTMLGVGFVACSDDDDDDGGRGSNSVGVLDKSSGLRITSAGGYNYVYNDNGQLLYILSGNSCRYEFSTPNKAIHIDDGDYDEAETYTIGYNGSGYVSKVSSKSRWEDADYDEWEEETEEGSLSYDGSGHLTKMIGTYKETGYEDGDKYSESGTTTYNLIWSNNLLQKVEFKDEGRNEYGSYKDVETFILSYDNDAMTNYTNRYLQYAYFIDEFLTEGMERFCYVGLLGKGPAFLPSKIDYEEKEEYYDESGKKRSYDYSGSYNYRYGFNSDGSISYDYRGSNRHTYSYDHVETGGNGSSTITRTDFNSNSTTSRRKNHLGTLRLHNQRRNIE